MTNRHVTKEAMPPIQKKTRIFVSLLHFLEKVQKYLTIDIDVIIEKKLKNKKKINKGHTISFQTFFVWAFKIVVNSWKFMMLLLFILWDDWLIFMISDLNEQLQQEMEYTLLKPDCHSWWISKMFRLVWWCRVFDYSTYILFCVHWHGGQCLQRLVPNYAVVFRLGWVYSPVSLCHRRSRQSFFQGAFCFFSLSARSYFFWFYQSMF